MKVRITYTVEVDDDFRRAINNHYGEPGLATRQQVADFHVAYGRSMNDDIAYDLATADLYDGMIGFADG